MCKHLFLFFQAGVVCPSGKYLCVFLYSGQQRGGVNPTMEWDVLVECASYMFPIVSCTSEDVRDDVLGLP